MNSRYPSILLIIFLLVASSGCTSQPPEEAVSDTVTGFLEAINEGDFNSAYNMYEGKDFLAVASVEMIFANKGIEPGSINNIEIASLEVVDKLAFVTAECSVSSVDLTGNQLDEAKTMPIYFGLQNTDLGWIITRVTFNAPLTVEDAEVVDIEVESTPVDTIADNAPVISAFAFVMLGMGVYLDRKDKSKKKESSRTIDVSGATAMQKEVIAQYVRIIPAQGVTAGKNATVDVWVKNFAQQPYENFAVKAKFGNTVEVENINLFFDNIAPGQTVKKTWVIKPKVAGWTSIEEPTAVFEYMGTKYMGVLDPVWIQVQ